MAAYLEKSPRSTGRKGEVEKGGRIGSTQCGVCVCWGAAHLGIMLTLSMPKERGRQAGVAE